MRKLIVASVAVAAGLALLFVTVRMVRRPVIDIDAPLHPIRGDAATIRIDLSADADPATLRANLNGEDVTRRVRFAPGGAVARVEDLTHGANVFEVAVRDREGNPHRQQSTLDVERLTVESDLDAELHQVFAAVLGRHREIRERSNPPLSFAEFSEEAAGWLERLEATAKPGERSAELRRLDDMRAELDHHEQELRRFYRNQRGELVAAGVEDAVAKIDKTRATVLEALGGVRSALSQASSGKVSDLRASRLRIEEITREPEGPEIVPHVVEALPLPETVPANRLFHEPDSTTSTGGDPAELLAEEVPNRDRRSWRLAFSPGAAPAQAQAGDPDLEPSTGVRFNPGDPNDPIVRKAAELEYDPIRIYEFVRNEIEFEAYIGFSRGARATLLAGRGNNSDQCALLVALLRASGHKARFVIGDVLAEAESVRSWLQVLDDASVTQQLSPYGARPTLKEVGNQAAFLLYEHWWVKALVPYGPDQGRDPDAPERWVFLDPSFKRHALRPGVNLPDLDFDFGFLGGGYLGTVKSQTATESYAEQYRSWLRSNQPGKSLEDVSFRGPIVREELGALPPTLPYQAVQYHVEFSDIESLPAAPIDPAATNALDRKDILRPRVILELYKGTEKILSRQFIQADIADRRISIGWKGETTADQDTINDQCHGDLFECENVANLDLLPVLYQEGVQLAVGTGAVRIGDKLSVVSGSTSFFRQVFHCFDTPPTLNSCYFTTNSELTAGSRFVLVTDYGQGSQGLIDERTRNLLEAYESLTPTGPVLQFPLTESLREDLVSELLFIGALRYSQRVGENNDLLASIDRIHVAREGIGQAQADLEVKYLGDTPVAVVPRTLFIDMHYRSSTLTTDTREFTDLTDARSIRLFRLGLVTSSALEHQLWEELTQFSAVSTVKGLQLVLQSPAQGIQVARLLPGQADQIPYQLPQSTKDTVTADLADGYTVTIPTDDFSIDQWDGVVFFKEKFEKNRLRMAAVISRLGDLANGGYTTIDEPFVFLVPPQYEICYDPYVYRAADPVNVASGNLDHSQKDIEITTRGSIPVLLSRAYHSRSDELGPFGFGWTHSYHLFAEAIDEDADGNQGEVADSDGVVSGVAFADGRGGIKRFGISGGNPVFGPFVAEPGNHDHAEAVNTGPAFELELRTRDGRRFHFQTLPAAAAVGDRGRLLWMEDRNGNRTELEYTSGRLERVLDPLGRALSFAYHPGTDLISSVSDWSGRTWRYSYVGNDLETVVDPLDYANGRVTWTYEYYANQLNPANDHNLKRVENALGEGPTYFYYNNDKAYKVVDDLGATTRFVYDVFRQETTEIDPLGRRHLYQYDDRGFLIRRVHPDGAVQDFGYDPATRERSSEIDELGNQTRRYYDAYGNPKGTLTPEGHWSSQVYFHEENPAEPVHSPRFDRVVQANDARGTVFRFDYDTAGNLIRETIRMDVDGELTTVELRRHEYDAHGNLRRTLENVDPSTPVIDQGAARITELRYDARNYHAVATIDSHGHETTNVWDVDLGEPDRGQLRRRLHERQAEYRDGTRQVTQLETEDEFDLLGRLASSRTPVGRETETVRDAAGRVKDEIVRARDETGSLVTRTTSHEYDAAGRRTRTVDALGNDVLFHYDGVGNLVKAIDPMGHGTRFLYDARNRRIETVDALGNSARSRFDARGQLVESLDPTGVSTTFEYDADGRLLASQDESGNRTSFVYDANGNRTGVRDPRANAGETVPNPAGQQVPVTNSDGLTETLVYDELNRLASVKDARDGRSEFELDLLGGQRVIRDAAGRETVQVFDRLGHLAVRRDPLGREERFNYGSLGELIEVQDRMGRSTALFYDFEQLKVQARFSDGSEATFGYDGFGNAILAASAEVSYVSNHDALGRLISRSDSRFQSAQSFGYDAAGRRISATDLDGGTTWFRRDDTGRVIEIRTPEGTEIERHYDGAGRLLAQYFSSGAHMRLAYEPNGRLDAIAHYSAVGGVIEAQSHGYDANGNRKQIVFSDASMESYEYSAHNRLRKAVYRDGSIEEFRYDAVGNRTRTLAGSVERFYFYDAANQLTHVATDAAGSNAVITCAHDPNGNRRSCTDTVTGAWQTYDYDTQDQLVRVRNQNGEEWSYGYDAVGQRIRQQAPSKSRSYVWADGNRVGEYEGGALVARASFGPGLDDLLQVARGGAIGHVHPDALGSVRAISSEAGAVVASYQHRAFGGVLAESGSFENDFRFTGRELDSNGLLYLRARFYDPLTGRFLSQDPSRFEGGINFFAYASNNPTTLVDRVGLSPMDFQAVSFFDLSQGSGYLNAIQAGLDVTSLGLDATGVGAAFSWAPDLLNAGISLARGDLSGAGLSTLAALPVIGGPANAIRLGRAGEQAAGILKNTTTIPSLLGTASYRVPDALDVVNRTIGEVKNVAYLPYTRQLQDFVAFARQEGFTFDLIVREGTGTRLSAPLQRALDALGVAPSRILP